MLAIQLLVCVVCGVIASVIASNKGRSAAGWFFGGFFAGIIGIIIVACLSNLKQEQAYRERMNIESQRLREQLRQERIKGEAFRQYAAERIDQHDQLLGVDTRTRTALPGGGDGMAQLPDGSANPYALTEEADPAAALARMDGAGIPPVQRAAARPATGNPNILWYYEFDGQSRGPVSDQEIRQLLRVGRIRGNTLLWAEGLGQWTFAYQIPTFAAEVVA